MTREREVEQKVGYSLVNHSQNLRINRLLHALGMLRQFLDFGLQLWHVVRSKVELSSWLPKLTANSSSNYAGNNICNAHSFSSWIHSCSFSRWATRLMAVFISLMRFWISMP